MRAREAMMFPSLGFQTVNSGPWARAWGVGVPLVVEQDLAVTLSDDECLRELWKHLLGCWMCSSGYS